MICYKIKQLKQQDNSKKGKLIIYKVENIDCDRIDNETGEIITERRDKITKLLKETYFDVHIKKWDDFISELNRMVDVEAKNIGETVISKQAYVK